MHVRTIPGSPEQPVLVLLHGRGDTEAGMATLGQELAPGWTIHALRAPFPAAPWGYGPGYAWYRFLGGRVPESESFLVGQHELDQALGELRVATPAGRLVLGGFSQGGTTALAWALRHPGAARGVLIFSGFLAELPGIHATPETVADTAFFWGHGTADRAMPFEAAEVGWAALNQAGARLEAHAYEGMPHAISSDERADAARWLNRIEHGRKA